MSDDETTTKPKVFLAKPPLNWGEMTQEEKLTWSEKLAQTLKPDDA
jgi:hypothetical protein